MYMSYNYTMMLFNLETKRAIISSSYLNPLVSSLRVPIDECITKARDTER